MAVVTFVSASGSPGVTATTLALATVWPRPVLLVEADPTGGSGLLAGWWKGSRNHPGLVDLVTAHRDGLLAETLPQLALPIENSMASVLVGSRSHEQAAGLARLWEPLADVVKEMSAGGQDILIDAGRLGLDGWPESLVRGADLTVLLTHTTLPALAAAMSWAGALAEDILPGHDVRVMLVGSGRPYGSAEVSHTLGLRVVGEISWDPRRAAVFSDGAPYPAMPGWRRLVNRKDGAERSFLGSRYLRSVRAAGEAVRAVIGDPERVDSGEVRVGQAGKAGR